MSEPEFLGPYRIIRVIGRGGMGTVYEATHAKTGEAVAVKLIAQHVADDPRFRRRFDAEVETLRRLRHPGIVRLVGYGEEDGRLFYSMEMVPGETLQQRIRDVKRMGWLPAVEITIQICSALKHAHDIGVIHRDLKPANLLLTADGTVKLVDFGIAKLFGYGEQTLAGSVLGTADYMAPEQAGDGPITPRTDLYSLGSVMYAMLSGRSPFAGKKLTQVIESLKHDRAVPLQLINPDVPPEVVSIVHDLLEKQPKDRPPTALAVMNRLKATRAGLQRSRTVALDKESTRVGGQTDSNKENLGDSDTQLSRITDASLVGSPDAATSETHPNPLTDAVGKQAAKAGSETAPRSTRPRVSHGGMRSASAASDNLPTAATQESRSKTDNDELEFTTKPPIPSQTRFQSVESSESGSSVFGHPRDEQQSATHWTQIASIAAMIAILIGGVVVFVQMIQTPSADVMFQQIATAARNDELTMQDSIIERFLIQYPDDENVAQVQKWKQQAEFDRTVKRLLAEARRSGGISKLAPASQAFLEAVNLRDTSPQAAVDHLQAWLDVFDSDEQETDDLNGLTSAPSEDTPLAELRRRMQGQNVRKLADLAREELVRLGSEPATTNSGDPRVNALMQRVEASKSMSLEKRRSLLQGIIRLYSDDPWANAIVATARESLESSP